tara:strand:+ start:2430 stop:3026 length:597 start_codon:yes stop_codon:yes gene_type:complete
MLPREFFYNQVLLSKSDCKIIEKNILENEDDVKKLGFDFHTGTAPDSLTGRFPYYNWLRNEEIYNIVVPKLKKVFNDLNLLYPLSIQCWANTFRHNEGIKWHHHADFKTRSFLCGNIFISGNELPGTTYKIGKFSDPVIKVYDEKNFRSKIGNLTMFKSHVDHCVYPNKSDQVRISLAFDLYPNKILDDQDRYIKIDK